MFRHKSCCEFIILSVHRLQVWNSNYMKNTIIQVSLTKHPFTHVSVFLLHYFLRFLSSVFIFISNTLNYVLYQVLLGVLAILWDRRLIV